MKKEYTAMLGIIFGLSIYFLITKFELLIWIIVGSSLLSLLSSSFVHLVARIWYKLAEFLGKVNGTIILSLVYFLILTPIAFLFGLFKGKAKLKETENSRSAFVERNHKYQPSDFDNPW